MGNPIAFITKQIHEKEIEIRVRYNSCGRINLRTKFLN
jgi:hypothetical protein